jgi:hypothetical protein
LSIWSLLVVVAVAVVTHLRLGLGVVALVDLGPEQVWL